MDDTKWKRLLNGLGDAIEPGCHIYYKLVSRDDVWPKWFDRADDQFFAEPVLYSEVEWIEFPDIYEDWVDPNNRKEGTTTKPQDVERIETIIKSIGNFELESLSNSLRLYGYREPSSERDG